MPGGSTLPRRAMGRLLRGLRQHAGKSQLAAGLAIDVSPQTVGRMEDGHSVRMSRPQLQALMEFYDAPTDARTDVLALYTEAKEAKGDPTGGWWRTYADLLAAHFDHYLSLEDAAQQLTTFRLALLPGLLQTREYRRVMISITKSGESPVNVERDIELVTLRGARLRSDSASLSVVAYLHEAVLRCPIGGREVMADQLRHLVSMSELPNVDIRVVPLSVGAHIGLVTQSFTVFEFSRLKSTREPEPPVVYVEGYDGALYLEDDAAVSRHRQALEGIERVTLDSAATRDLVLTIAEEYES